MLSLERFSRALLLKQSGVRDPNALHVIVPHCTNWRLTEACVQTFDRLTTMPHSITVVNNFDRMPANLELLENPRVTLIEHRYTTPARVLGLFIRKRHGSKENAIALDAAIRLQPWFKWGFMTHTDSSPLVKGWERHFFDNLGGGKIIANYRDTRRVFAGHASGALFLQSELLEKNVSLAPVYDGKEEKMDVGDMATVVLHDFKKGQAPVLPNTRNEATLVEKLAPKFPQLFSLAKDGSTITFDASASIPVYGHLGRGTPRSLKDPSFRHKLPQDFWIEYLESIRSH